ncbi:MAG: hydantoinase/oxoprolinase family protein [Anaerolineae bacterium]
MMEHLLRIGIDVGGTFTKAVAVDARSLEVVARAMVPTTHTAKEGVSAGVVQTLQTLLAFCPSHDMVTVVAHSTTQAVNALLEGDVAAVGIIGMGAGRDRGEAQRYTAIGPIQLTPERFLSTYHRFLDTTQGLSPEVVDQAIQELRAEGAAAIVASAAFGVDDPTGEQLVLERATLADLPACAGHELTGLYGLEVRTITAAINASILPTMLETARYVETGLQESGIISPLLIMRGDGGVMEMAAFQERPILTVLSGPAASMAGTLRYLGIADGIGIEVGGTSTNIGVIRGGRPALKYIKIMDHPTCVRSLDVRVLGVAGGSMVRLRGRRLADVGPRSAHIAGLPYTVFASPEELRGAELVTIAPRSGDLEDYVAVRTGEGRLFALTLTCAANLVGLVPEGDYARGNPEAARRAFAPLASRLGLSVEEAAQCILETAANRVFPVIRALSREYRLDSRRLTLVGGGGGAAVLLPIIARRLGCHFMIPTHAEVISSIGVALSMIRAEVERTVPRPGPADVASITREAEAAAVRLGAAPRTVQVSTERVPERSALRAVAVGAVELQAGWQMPQEISCQEARARAAQVLGLPQHTMRLIGDTRYYVVFAGAQAKGWLFRRQLQPVVVLDRLGVPALIVQDGEVLLSYPQELLETLRSRLNGKISLFAPSFARLHLITGGHHHDLSLFHGSRHVLEVVTGELQEVGIKEQVVAILERG